MPARGSDPPAARKRADAARNKQALLEVTAAAFVDSGVNAPVRDIARHLAALLARGLGAAPD